MYYTCVISKSGSVHILYHIIYIKANDIAKIRFVKYHSNYQYMKSFIFHFKKQKIIVVILSLYLDLTLSVWILTENKIAPTQDLEELYSLYKHERDDRIMLREESGQLSPELRLKVHLSKTHNTDSSDSILISVLLFHTFCISEEKSIIFMRLRSNWAFLIFMT